jgi:hypothetical protein
MKKREGKGSQVMWESIGKGRERRWKEEGNGSEGK